MTKTKEQSVSQKAKNYKTNLERNSAEKTERDTKGYKEQYRA